MDLISAKVEAAKKSRETRKPQYIFVVPSGEDEGECLVTDSYKKGVIQCFKNGSEVALEPEQSKESEAAETKPKGKSSKVDKVTKEAKPEASVKEGAKQNTKTMATTAATKKPAKKAAKKSPAKTEKKAAYPNALPKATTILLSERQWAALEKELEKNGASIREAATEALIKGFKLPAN